MRGDDRGGPVTRTGLADLGAAGGRACGGEVAAGADQWAAGTRTGRDRRLPAHDAAVHAPCTTPVPAPVAAPPQPVARAI
jgi:hypothetical protein